MLVQTGLTRDGTFLIENGRISRPVTNFRFNQSLAELPEERRDDGAAHARLRGEDSAVGAPVVVPALKVRSFNLSSVSDAI
jgi:predicted Zn-dependent protease